jgi:hypothetical protein
MSARRIAIFLTCLVVASCASEPDVRSQRNDVDAVKADREIGRPIIGNAINSDTRGPAAPSVNSGDGTPSVGTGIVPSDLGLSLTPGFPVTR